ncbi:MAG: hypothetical protein H6765_09370 [Candidatus Peribacteria bacterium]|nr:MAG: hypothetical protein H6765_09370 [Candidatus Peribacteria bacterium]
MNQVVVKVNGTPYPATINGTVWSVTVPVQAGNNVIEVTAFPNDTDCDVVEVTINVMYMGSCHGTVDCNGWTMHFAHPLLSDAVISLFDQNNVLVGFMVVPANNNPSTTVSDTWIQQPAP